MNNAKTDDLHYRMSIFDRCAPEWRSIYNDFHPTQVDEADDAGCRTARDARAFLERRYGKPPAVQARVVRR